MCRIAGASGIFLLLLAAGVVAPARAQTDGWTLRLKGLVSDEDIRRVNGSSSGRNELRLDGGSGFELGAEYRQNRWIGWELSLGRLNLDADYRVVHIRPSPADPTVPEEVTAFTGTGDFEIQPLALSLLVHLIHDRPLSLYFAPQVAWVEVDLQIPEAPRGEPEEFAYGGKAGLELRPGSSRWSVGLEVRQLKILYEPIVHGLYGDLSVRSAALFLGYRLGAAPRD